MRVIVVGHVRRMNWIEKLQEVFPTCSAVVDFANRGALEGHIAALSLAHASGERCIIMEDDAIPVEGFMEHAANWCSAFPNSLVSFYLGTGRPPAWQARVDIALEQADDAYITLPRLIHGVCYSIPANRVAAVLARIKALGGSDEGADFLIGRMFGGEIVYPVESLVEHRDDGSIERHPDGEPRIERRVARALAAPLMYGR